MKLSPEAEAEIERLSKEFWRCGPLVEPAMRAAMRWAYRDAANSIRNLKDGWGLAEESTVAECAAAIEARAGVKE